MGIGDLLGLGKKEKVAFRPLREVSELRTRLDAEQRKNFPNAARFQELTQYAKQIIEILQDTEINGLRTMILEKIAALDEVISGNERALVSGGLKERALANLYKLKEAATMLSEK